jgi:hypothetical protein
MAQDTEHEQALQERADALVAEQQLLQKRLLQLQQELESEADAVQQLATGADVTISTVHTANMSTCLPLQARAI